MKRFICILLALVLLFSMTISAQAAENPQVQPRFKHIIMFATEISYGNWGIATCTSTVTVDSGYRAVLTLELQRTLENGSWETVETWSAEGYAGASISERRALYSNYSYRVVAAVSVYDMNGIRVEDAMQIDS